MFRFRLQRVLELRQEAEQAASRTLGVARDAADEARRTQDELAQLHETSRKEIGATQQREPRIGHLQQLGVVLQSLETRLEGAVEQVQVADGVVAEAQSKLELAARDRRVLDRLKERHATVWRAEEAHKDRLQMDEIALARFGRKQETRDDERASSSSHAGAQQGAAPRNDGQTR